MSATIILIRGRYQIFVLFLFFFFLHPSQPFFFFNLFKLLMAKTSTLSNYKLVTFQFEAWLGAQPEIQIQNVTEAYY